jgi:hypothetical protein
LLSTHAAGTALFEEVGMKTIRTILAAAALSLGAASTASAGTTTVNFQSSADKGIKKLGAYAGTATYDDMAGLLTISIQNTSTDAKAGRLTGFAFNIDGSATAGYRDGDDLATRGDEDAFDDARMKKNSRVVKAKPFGMLDAGAALDGKWNSSAKKAARGIATGATGTFTFDVVGGTGLTAANFLTGNNGLVAAFRGKKADKVGSTVSDLIISLPPVTGGNTETPPVIIDIPDLNPPQDGIPPIDVGGNDPGPGGNVGGNDGGPNNGGGPVAVPLPPAAWPALATFAVMAAGRLKRKFGQA